MVDHHTCWVANKDAADAYNLVMDQLPVATRPTVRNREATGMVGVSQACAGSAYDMQPAGLAATTLVTLDFEISMHISSAKAAYDVLEAAGHRVPISHRLGDGLANSGEFCGREPTWSQRWPWAA